MNAVIDFEKLHTKILGMQVSNMVMQSVGSIKISWFYDVAMKIYNDNASFPDLYDNTLMVMINEEEARNSNLVEKFLH